MKGYMYILECNDQSFYVGSTSDLIIRFQQHQGGDGSNYTKERLPVSLIYYEEFESVREAFKREKQIQGWGRAKKIALMKKNIRQLHLLSQCQNVSHHKNYNSNLKTSMKNNSTDKRNN